MTVGSNLGVPVNSKHRDQNDLIVQKVWDSVTIYLPFVTWLLAAVAGGRHVISRAMGSRSLQGWSACSCVSMFCILGCVRSM